MSTKLGWVAGFCVVVLAVVYGVRYFLADSRRTLPEKAAAKVVNGPVSATDPQAVAAIMTLPPEARREPLRKLIQENAPPAAVSTALVGLAAQWDYDSMPRTLELLDDPSPEVRAAAGCAAQRLMSVDFGFRGADSPEKRAAAAERLRKHWEWFKDSPKLKFWKERLASGDLDGKTPRGSK